MVKHRKALENIEKHGKSGENIGQQETKTRENIGKQGEHTENHEKVW